MKPLDAKNRYNFQFFVHVKRHTDTGSICTVNYDTYYVDISVFQDRTGALSETGVFFMLSDRFWKQLNEEDATRQGRLTGGSLICQAYVSQPTMSKWIP